MALYRVNWKLRKNVPSKQEMQVWIWVRKISWRRKWKHTLVFLHGKSYGQRSLNSVQSLSRVWLFATPWTAALQASLSISNSQSLLRLMPNETVIPSNHLILHHPLLLPPQSFPASGSFQISQLFTSGSQSIGVSASTSGLPMNIQDRFPLGWTSWISLSTRDS